MKTGDGIQLCYSRTNGFHLFSFFKDYMNMQEQINMLQQKILLFFSKKALIIFLLSSIGLLGILFFTYTKTPSNAAKVEGERVLYWKNKINTVGEINAYQELLLEDTSTLSGFASTTKHFDGHAFGAALYATKGLLALNVCDEKLQYACLHEVYGRALTEHGLSVIPELNEACANTKDPLVCEHGIGHGLIGSFGYDPTSAKKAVATCKTISQRGEVVGACESGLFMEYINRTMLADTKTFPVSKKDPYAPCEELNLGPNDMPQCVFELPRLWFISFFSEQASDTALKEIGTYCNAYTDISALNSACARGAAEVARHAPELTEQESNRICEKMFADTNRQNACKTQVQKLINLQ